MTIRKNDENSEFWTDAKAASRVVAKYPDWKRGVLVRRPLHIEQDEPAAAPVDELMVAEA